MQMVILCGGVATRLGSLAKDIPKSMIQIHGKPFLEHQIEMLYVIILYFFFSYLGMISGI